MKKKKKFYVIWSGKKNGIFDSWDECKANIHGVEGAQYKSFKTEAEAKFAFSKNYYASVNKSTGTGKSLTMSTAQKAQFGEPNMETVSVDAACSGNPGTMEYQCVNTKTKEVLFKMGPYKNSTNNIGEFLALVHGLALLQKKEE